MRSSHKERERERKNEDDVIKNKKSRATLNYVLYFVITKTFMTRGENNLCTLILFLFLTLKRKKKVYRFYCHECYEG